MATAPPSPIDPLDLLRTRVVVTPRQAEEILLVSRGRIAALMRAGTLQYREIAPHTRRILTSSILAYLNATPAECERGAA
jgi:hypothetical protein